MASISAIKGNIGTYAQKSWDFVKAAPKAIREAAVDSYHFAKENPKKAGFIAAAGALVATVITSVINAFKNKESK